jgi:hypothetical protein
MDETQVNFLLSIVLLVNMFLLPACDVQDLCTHHTHDL